MTDADERKSRRSERSAADAVRLVLLALIGLAVLVLILQNQEPVQTRLLAWSVEMPRFLLLAVFYGLGVATGWAIRWRGGR